jgi:S1-C subfamily serine protease
LWDLRVDQQVEERRAYRAARSLGNITLVDFLRLKRDLETAPGVVLAGLTREQVDRAISSLAEEEIAAGAEASGQSTVSEIAPAPTGAGWLKRNRSIVIVAVVVAALSAVVVTQRQPTTDGGSSSDEPLTTAEIGRRIERSAVHLQCVGSLGSGFFVAPDLVVTNAHVLCDGPHIDVATVDGKLMMGRVVGRDERTDLALVSVEGATAEPLPLGDATALSRGDRIFAMGSPLGLDFTLSQGIVSHPDRVLLGVSYIQIDASVHPGNSGGALVDDAGRVVGIVSMQAGSNDALGFAVPVNYLHETADLLAERSVWFDVDRWERRKISARRAETAEIEQVRAELGRPMLASAWFRPPQRMRALVGKTSSVEPSEESFFFTLRDDAEILCRPMGTVTRWRRWGSDAADAQSRWAQWLEANGLETRFWIGTADLSISGCQDSSRFMGAVLELDGGSEQANSARVVPGR